MNSTLTFFFLLSFAGASMAAGKPASMKGEHQLMATGAEVEVTRKIRETLVKDKHLSIKAQNINIIANGNDITLKGDVTARKEMERVIDLARNSAPGKNILNELTIR